MGRRHYASVGIRVEDYERLSRLADATGEPLTTVISRALDSLEAQEKNRRWGPDVKGVVVWEGFGEEDSRDTM